MTVLLDDASSKDILCSLLSGVSYTHDAGQNWHSRGEMIQQLGKDTAITQAQNNEWNTRFSN